MRKIGIKELDDIAIGAALLGAGGGGDPYIGKLMAIQAIKEYGEVNMISVDDVPDDAIVLPIAMMGAPTVLAEKAMNGNEYNELFEKMEKVLDGKVYAVMPIEAGGVNSMIPFVAAARNKMPLVDVDAMGRAFPELQMVTFTLAEIEASPMCLTDEKGNSCIINTITNKWTEEIARSITMACGGSVSVILYPVTGKKLKKYGIRNIVTKSEEIGRTIREIKKCENNPEDGFLKAIEGYKLFKGKIVDIRRETKSGFNYGEVIFAGIGECKGSKCSVTFQNENMCATRDGKVVATTPDLISVVDTETFMPITTDAFKYGKRGIIIGMKCAEQWRTKEGLDIVGPSYFKIDADYVPIEELVGGEGNV